MLGKAMDIANKRAVRLAIDCLAPRDGERIADIGCGTGMALRDIGRRASCTLVGVDPSATMLAAARARLGQKASLYDAQMGALPFPDRSIDAVLAVNVLYFADKSGAMLADLHRILRPGGRLVAYVTHRKSMERWAFAATGHHRLFDAAELQQAFEHGGFAIDAVRIHEADVGAGVRGLFAQAIRQHAR
jgi:ubiquinone/menaquinone biosynthesis C-methylase UbiE